MANEIPAISPDMQRLYKRFERWRSAHTGRLPIPERLWRAAAELAREHGVCGTARHDSDHAADAHPGGGRTRRWP